MMDPTDPMSVQAHEFVKKLQESKIIFRTFNKPVANIKLSNSDKDYAHYSIKGYFIPVAGTRYQFITNLPLRQYWIPDAQVSLFD